MCMHDETRTSDYMYASLQNAQDETLPNEYRNRHVNHQDWPFFFSRLTASLVFTMCSRLLYGTNKTQLDNPHRLYSRVLVAWTKSSRQFTPEEKNVDDLGMLVLYVYSQVSSNIMGGPLAIISLH